VRGTTPVWLVAPDGVPIPAIAPIADASLDRRSNRHSGGARRMVEVVRIPFLAQDRYDQLLWACDVNFVRGEDSFVRAQWAGRPFVWNIYPTDDGAHWVKLSAFLARYTEGLDRTQAGVLTALWEAWKPARHGSGGRHEPPGTRGIVGRVHRPA
jgi:uncharacterized repeat protein (TIGR03837 family)